MCGIKTRKKGATWLISKRRMSAMEVCMLVGGEE